MSLCTLDRTRSTEHVSQGVQIYQLFHSLQRSLYLRSVICYMCSPVENQTKGLNLPVIFKLKLLSYVTLYLQGLQLPHLQALAGQYSTLQRPLPSLPLSVPQARPPLSLQVQPLTSLLARAPLSPQVSVSRPLRLAVLPPLAFHPPEPSKL